MQALKENGDVMVKIKYTLVAYLGQIRSLDTSLPEYHDICENILKSYKIILLFYLSKIVRDMQTFGESMGMSSSCQKFLNVLYQDFKSWRMREEETMAPDNSGREDVVSRSSFDPETSFVDSSSEKSKGSSKKGSEKSVDPEYLVTRNEVLKKFIEEMHAIQNLHMECFVKMASTIQQTDGYFDKKLKDMEKLVGLMDEYYKKAQPLILIVDK